MVRTAGASRRRRTSSERIPVAPARADEIARLVAALNAHAASGSSARSTACAASPPTPRTSCARRWRSLMGEIELTLRRPRSRRAARRSETTLEELGRLSRLVESLLDAGALRRRRAAACSRESSSTRRRCTRAVLEPYEALFAARQLARCDGRRAGRRDRRSAVARPRVANLVDNACKFTPAGGEVAILVRRGGGRVEVRDTGAGLPQGEARAHLRALLPRRRRRAPAPSGFGLGLALAREIARAIGGELRLLPSQSGAAFRLDLPS